MKKIHLWILSLLTVAVIVLTILLVAANSQLSAVSAQNAELEQQILSLQNRLSFFPMTQAEEDLFDQNLETIQTVFPEGDLAYNAAMIVHEYHRIGTIPIGHITFAESVTDSTAKQLHFVTSDNTDYYMVFSGGTVEAFWMVTDSGEQMIFCYVQ